MFPMGVNTNSCSGTMGSYVGLIGEAQKMTICVLTARFPLRIFASKRISPFPSMGPRKVATFCSTTAKFSPWMNSPLGPFEEGGRMWMVSVDPGGLLALCS